jgi:GLPGLI family protein
MKKLFVVSFIFLSAIGIAQPKIINQAVISAKTTIFIPEDATNMGDGNQMSIMGMSSGDETKTTTWFKGDMLKIVNDGEMGKTTIIIDKKNKKTTTLLEIMGKKTGYYSTEDDEAAMKKRADSMMGARKNGITSVNIDYLDETKKIAGYNCKRALIKTTRENGKIDSMYIWFTPDVKMNEGYVFKGGMMMGFGGGGGNAMTGFDKLNGFPMQYEIKMRRGMIFTIEVTKIDMDKSIDDKEFDIPKGFELHSIKDMQGPGGNFQFRMGGS